MLPKYYSVPYQVHLENPLQLVAAVGLDLESKVKLKTKECIVPLPRVRGEWTLLVKTEAEVDDSPLVSYNY